MADLLQHLSAVLVRGGEFATSLGWVHVNAIEALLRIHGEVLRQRHVETEGAIVAEGRHGESYSDLTCQVLLIRSGGLSRPSSTDRWPLAWKIRSMSLR